jgi:hypothetical protein
MKNLQYYKPNKKNTGHACSFWVNEDGTVQTSMLKQSGWNEKTRNGTFSANKDNPMARVISKLSHIECASIISAVRRKTEFSAYHRSPKQILKISFKSVFDKENVKKHIGYSFSINKEDSEDTTQTASFYVMFDHGEAEMLAIYLDKAINESFNGSNSFGNNKNYTNKVEKQAPKSTIKEAPQQEADVTEDFDEDDW